MREHGHEDIESNADRPIDEEHLGLDRRATSCARWPFSRSHRDLRRLAQSPSRRSGWRSAVARRSAPSDVSHRPCPIYNPDANEWASVDRNQPLTTGDRIATDNDGRAEITLGTTTLRLDAATELEVVRLDDTRYVVRLQSGSVAARLRNPQALAEFEIDTDEGRFRIQTVGRYQLDRL